MIHDRPYGRVLLLFLLLAAAGTTYAQEMDYDDMLQRVDTVENPVYKPVIALGYGVLNFWGDVNNSISYPVTGNQAVRFSVSTFIDNRHTTTANFFFHLGSLTGNHYSVQDINRNLNFSTSLYSIGATARYGFGHFIPEEFLLRPYVAVGIENINFSTKGDLFDDQGRRYHYWDDGTIRDRAPDAPGTPEIIYRDYHYETDMRMYERENFGLGNYNQRSVGIPMEVGFMLNLSDRVTMSMGSEYHLTFTDYIDNVAAEGTSIPGNKGNDSYLFTHVTLHFDLFSDPSTRTVDLMYAEMELDTILYDDEDGDFVLDVADHCPGTPFGVPVDTLGCPLDGDNDGIPDYLDEEPNSPEGVWVDEQGRTLSEEAFRERLQRKEALNREDLEAYMALFEDTYQEKRVTEIPEKFEPLDSDDDGYISFDELLKVIDDYFDFRIELSIEELRELNEFFFSQ